MLLKVIKSGSRLYRSASSLTQAVLHPVRTLQDSVREYLVKKLTASIIAVAGPRVADALAVRLDKGYPFRLHVGIPKRASRLLDESDAIPLLEKLINDALGIPLAALGLRLGALAIRRDDTGMGVCLDGEFRISSTPTALPKAA